MNRSDLIKRHNYFRYIEEDYLRPTEFDAYSKSIVLEIKTFYNSNEENKEIVKSALRSGNIHLLMDKKVLSEPSLIVLFLWEEKRPEYIKTLLKRIYNEVINENNTK